MDEGSHPPIRVGSMRGKQELPGWPTAPGTSGAPAMQGPYHGAGSVGREGCGEAEDPSLSSSDPLVRPARPGSPSSARLGYHPPRHPQAVAKSGPQPCPFPRKSSPPRPGFLGQCFPLPLVSELALDMLRLQACFCVVPVQARKCAVPFGRLLLMTQVIHLGIHQQPISLPQDPGKKTRISVVMMARRSTCSIEV